jgi:signal transduction histidine kinase/CheY-like chemotaxis protein
MPLAVADARGDIFCSTAPRAGPVNVADRHYLRLALAERRFVVGELVMSRVSGSRVLSTALPVSDGPGEPEAVVIVGVDIAWLQDRAVEVPVRQGSRVVVLDRQGTVLVRHPDPEGWIGKSQREAEVVSTALESPGPGRLRARGPEGVDLLYAFKPVGDEGQPGRLLVLAGIRSEVALAPARAVLWKNLPLLGLVGLLVVGMAWLGGERLFVRPARALAAAAVRMGEGDLSARTGLPHDVSTMGRLARAFDEMAGKLAERDERLRGQAALEQALGEAERSSRAKSEFLARVSHELRTPLNAVLGFAQLLEGSATSAGDRESVEQITRAGQHLLRLINEVLDISRIEAGRIQISPEPVRVGSAIGQALDLSWPLAAERRVDLRAGDDRFFGRHVWADTQRLQQVLLNLVSNAIKYNREGGSVAVTCAPAPGDRLRISVRDSGFGIAPGLRERLFRPFDRLGAEARGSEGTGLGLALSKGLTELMGGTIGVESVEGQGSTFWVEFREAEAPAERAAAAEAEPMIPGGRVARRGTILYIEDNLSNLRLIEKVVARRPGVRLIPAMQGRLGLDLARDHRPGLILLDLHLPDLPGEQVLQQLRAEADLRDTPVVVLSADATPGQIKRLLSSGARAYLTKPIDIHQLLALMDTALAPAES